MLDETRKEGHMLDGLGAGSMAYLSIPDQLYIPANVTKTFLNGGEALLEGLLS